MIVAYDWAMRYKNTIIINIINVFIITGLLLVNISPRKLNVRWSFSLSRIWGPQREHFRIVRTMKNSSKYKKHPELKEKLANENSAFRSIHTWHIIIIIIIIILLCIIINIILRNTIITLSNALTNQ